MLRNRLRGFHRDEGLFQRDGIVFLNVPLDDLCLVQPLAQIWEFEIAHVLRTIRIPRTPPEYLDQGPGTTHPTHTERTKPMG